MPEHGLYKKYGMSVARSGPSSFREVPPLCVIKPAWVASSMKPMAAYAFSRACPQCRLRDFFC